LEETTWRKVVRVRDNQFAPAHVPYSSEFSDLIGSRYKHVLIVRHPFDVAVSALHYIQSSKSRHRLNNFFSNDTLSFSDKLRFIIEGIPSEKLNGQKASKPLVDIYDSYSPWLNDGNTLVVKFEDLVGPGGGGSANVQRSAVNTIFSFIGLPQAYQPSGGQIFSKSSRTFRSGQIDGYRQLSEVDWSDFRHPEFVSVAGRFGYSL